MIDSHYTRFSILADTARLDKCLAQVLPAYSRALLQQVISGGGVAINGDPCRRPAQKVAAGSELALDERLLARLQPPATDACVPEPLPLQIVYEDDVLLVVNKPAGCVTHPGHGNRSGTLQAGLLHHHAAAAVLVRAGIVHRLDKDTSGLLAVAKTAAAQKHLINQFKKRQIGRTYLALVYGNPPATGVISRPLRRDRHDPLRMAVSAAGREAITTFHCQQRWRGFALLCCQLQTGRTHQIRVHLEHSGYPLVGDKVYRRRAAPLPPTVHAARQMLHAARLRLVHPQTGSACEWECALPADMQAALDALDALNAAKAGD